MTLDMIKDRHPAFLARTPKIMAAGKKGIRLVFARSLQFYSSRLLGGGIHLQFSFFSEGVAYFKIASRWQHLSSHFN